MKSFQLSLDTLLWHQKLHKAREKIEFTTLEGNKLISKHNILALKRDVIR
jgi:hypothetical protein